jgi:hypothetical protein
MQLDDFGEDVNVPRVSASNDTVHVLFDTNTLPRKILYRRSTNGGKKFAPSVRLDVIDAAGAPSDGDSTLPGVAVLGTTVHVVWQDDLVDAAGNPVKTEDIFYTRSLDDGATFGIPVNMSNSPKVREKKPVVAAEGSLVGIAYESRDSKTKEEEIGFLRSTDGGAMWESGVNLTKAAGAQVKPAIDISGDTVHVAFLDEATLRVGYVRSTDGGLTFSPLVDLPGPGNIGSPPAVLAEGSMVHVVACHTEDPADPSDGYDALYYRSTDGGETFAPPVVISRRSEKCDNPAIDGRGDHLHIVFDNDLFQKAEVFYIRSDDGGLSFAAARNLSDDPGNSAKASVAVIPDDEGDPDDDRVYITWNDKTNFLFSLHEGQSLPLREGGRREFGEEDVIRFTGAAYEMVLDGGDVGLEDLGIDGLAVIPPAPPATLPSFVLSLRHSGRLPDVGLVDDSDLLLFTPTSLGETTTGTFSFFFDGSDIGLTSSDEDVKAVDFGGGILYLATDEDFSLNGGLTGTHDDVFTCNGFTPGKDSACASTDLPFDGSAVGFSGEGVRGFAFGASGEDNVPGGRAFFSFDTSINMCHFPDSPPASPTSLVDCGSTVPLVEVFHPSHHFITEKLADIAFQF